MNTTIATKNVLGAKCKMLYRKRNCAIYLKKKMVSREVFWDILLYPIIAIQFRATAFNSAVIDRLKGLSRCKPLHQGTFGVHNHITNCYTLIICQDGYDIVTLRTMLDLHPTVWADHYVNLNGTSVCIWAVSLHLVLVHAPI